MANKQALGARADLFAAHNSKQAHDVVAAVAAVSLSDQEGEETTVAAVRPGVGSGQRGGSGGQRGGSGQRGGGRKGKKKQGRSGGVGGSGQQVSHTLTHEEQARVGSGLCFSHFCLGANARRCEAPCTWSGN
jgi:hypothetical protein